MRNAVPITTPNPNVPFPICHSSNDVTFGTKLRIWATSVLKELVIKGYALDDERLKQGKHFGKDYFDDLLERIREIRTSERRYYQKITDIYAECSADYDSKSECTVSNLP